ncbi:MAG TPA: Nramp family divalent metal transporter [Chthonomonadaceae bacterium]|nr:Nramp family divalent metal transporter [Chthonomonadaceae bacterium]
MHEGFETGSRTEPAIVVPEIADEEDRDALLHVARDGTETLREAPDGWRAARESPSMPEVFRSIAVPRGHWLRRLLAFAGPGYLVAVGYMDPGNWATDISGGALYNYRLLSVVLASSLMAMFLQALAAKLGIVTGRDLAQACHNAYGRKTSALLWISAEIAIIACDIAEVIGAAIALNLLFRIPMVLGVILTGLDVLLVLALQHKGFRWIETLVITLIATMMVIFCAEILYAKPDWWGGGGVMSGFLIRPELVRDHGMLYIGLGILGATVMPHNLYLHSSIVQTRRFGLSIRQLRDAIRMACIDSSVALTLAFFVNAAILILAAAAFYRTGHHEIGDIQGAYKLLTPLLGASLATPLFAIALLASGQNSTLTGTMAGQVVLEGFTRFRIAPWARRMISRVIAIAPAIVAVAFYGEAGTGRLLIGSQVVLSVQLSFAVIPLVQFTSSRAKMGPFVNGTLTRLAGWTTAAVIAGLNAYLVYVTVRQWFTG